jgi:hypothetical protein
VQAKKKKFEETQGRPNHRGGLLYIIDFEHRRVGKIVGVSGKRKRILFRNKSCLDAVDTNRVRMAANFEEYRG